MWAVGGAIDMAAVLAVVARVVGTGPDASRFLDRPQSVGENDSVRRMVAEPLIRVKGLVRVFRPTRVLDGVDLDVAAGEAVALLGPNGAGKTTLLKIIATLLAAHARHGARWPATTARARRSVRPLSAWCPRRPLYEDLTALENLSFWATTAGLRGRRRHAGPGAGRRGPRAPRRRAGCARSSAGMKRRLALAASGWRGPRVLLLDEPFAALDARARKWLEARLESFKAAAGRS
jgi:ABC-type multidrug transport system ATPase subunit